MGEQTELVLACAHTNASFAHVLGAAPHSRTEVTGRLLGPQGLGPARCPPAHLQWPGLAPDLSQPFLSTFPVLFSSKHVVLYFTFYRSASVFPAQSVFTACPQARI